MNFHTLLCLLIPISNAFYTQKRNIRKIRSLKTLKLSKLSKNGNDIVTDVTNQYIMALESKLSVQKPIHELVSVKNTQKIHPIDLKKVQLLVHQIQKILNVDEFAVDIWFCSNNKMRELNNEWRDKSKSTDILSFPVNDFTSPGEFEDTFDSDTEKHLGDIVVCPSYVYRRMLEDKRDNTVGLDNSAVEDAGVSKAMSTVYDIDERIGLLMIHGVLHLIGYDHETAEEWTQMTQKEDEIIRLIREHKKSAIPS